MSQRQKLNLPKHQNPTGRDRTASAPYNFVPLPEVVVTAVDDAHDLPDHDRYYPDRYTGYFEVTLTTKSPLYVRCPPTREEFDLEEQGKDRNGHAVDNQTRYADRIKNTPDFFYTRDRNRPVIPGSSLRGMLRSLLEVVSYSKMQWVTDKRLFFRTVDDTAIGKYYRGRMIGKVEAGFLIRKPGGYVTKVCEFARVHRDKLGGTLYEGKGPNKTPRWEGEPCQWIPVWVRLSRDRRFVEEIHYEEQQGEQRGILVITGDIPRKKKEFVFLLPNDKAEEIPVPEEIIERFHDDDQITQWQERAFPKNRPEENCRERDGMLRTNPPEPGDPVFFLRENGQLTFIGRAQMFRLPYQNCPLDLVPKELRRPEDIDYSEAIFGFVRSRQELEDMTERGVIQEIPKQGDKRRAYAGRVYVTDAVLEEGQGDYWLSASPIKPKILATPKPTAFQHYLVQEEPDRYKTGRLRRDGTEIEETRLRHYDGYDHPPSNDETVIRGHKLYWHQGERSSKDIEDPNASPISTQHTQFRPVKAGVRFKFRIYFENLSDRELGALCWVLHPLGDPAKEYCHHLGMGKPLGMGAVKLEATLHLTDRRRRYGSLFDGDHWQTGTAGPGESLSDRATLERLTHPFERHILETLGLHTRCQHLFEVKRIGMLLKMLEWPGYSPDPNNPCFLNARNRPNTRYMTIQPNEYRNRPVLPDPSAFDPNINKLADL
jgi:CRISPR-associated protein (TIGR03986 family)